MKLACRTIPSSIAVTSDLRCDTGFCRLSPSEVTQIVMNLVGNANHAMEGKGALAIRLQPVVIDTVRSVRGMALQPGCYACLTVQDDGPGMPPWLADRVFEPFFTTKDIEHGTGLGLSVVHGLVGQRGGAVLLSTAPGQGARFDIYIPLVSSGQG
jgi:signal transduction histidine kinase